MSVSTSLLRTFSVVSWIALCASCFTSSSASWVAFARLCTRELAHDAMIMVRAEKIITINVRIKGGLYVIGSISHWSFIYRSESDLIFFFYRLNFFFNRQACQLPGGITGYWFSCNGF